MTAELTPPPRSPGRPRSQRAERAIVEATLDLLAEQPGVAGVSIEAVAARAGVGKTTIYRRWPNKEALIVDALGSLKQPLPELAGVSVRDDLIAVARAFTAEHGRKHARCMWNVMGGAEKHPGLLAQYQAKVLAPRRAVLRDLLRRGVDTGELRPDLDLETAMIIIVGALTFPGRSPGPAAPQDDEFAVRIVDAFLDGLAPR